MGIVLKESFKNTATLILAIGIGAINTLFLYVYFLETNYYGLVTFVLSTAFILKPFIALGVNFSVIKFFSVFTDKKEKDKFLSSALWIPLFIIVPVGLLGSIFYEKIATLLSEENTLVKDYTYLIFLVAIANAYFEIFYAWSKVHLKSVFGNILKELFIRVSATFLLTAVYFKIIDSHQFVLCLVGAYFIQTFIMLIFALYLYRPKFSFSLPSNFKEVVKYSLYIILAGSAATILIDIDKFMIPQKEVIAQVAFYAVAVYIGSVVEIPGRAMSQIVQPLTAKALNKGNDAEVLDLYQKTSINLLVISGLIFILINSNIASLYQLLPKEYTNGVWVVLMISIAKLYHMLLGNNGAIITNSKYYKILLPYGIAMATAVVVLNNWLINKIGITGAALATLLVVLLFNTIKIFYVKAKFNIQPTTFKTWVTLGLILILTLVGRCVELDIHPLLSILIKSIIVSIIYIWALITFKLSNEIVTILQGIRKKIIR